MSLLIAIIIPIAFIYALNSIDSPQTIIKAGVVNELAETNLDEYNKIAEGLDRNPLIELSTEKRDILLVSLSKGQIDAVIDFNNGLIIQVNSEDQLKNQSLAIFLNSLSTPATDIRLEFIDYPDLDPVRFLLPGQLVFSVLSLAIFSVTYSLLNLRSSGILKRLVLTRLNRSSVIAGIIFSRLTQALVQTAAILYLASVFFEYNVINNTPLALDLLLYISVVLTSIMPISIIIANYVDDHTLLGMIFNLITIPQLIFGGVIIPVEQLPAGIQFLKKIAFMSVINDDIRGIVTGSVELSKAVLNILPLVIVALICLVYLSRKLRIE